MRKKLNAMEADAMRKTIRIGLDTRNHFGAVAGMAIWWTGYLASLQTLASALRNAREVAYWNRLAERMERINARHEAAMRRIEKRRSNGRRMTVPMAAVRAVS